MRRLFGVPSAATVFPGESPECDTLAVASVCCWQECLDLSGDALSSTQNGGCASQHRHCRNQRVKPTEFRRSGGRRPICSARSVRRERARPLLPNSNSPSKKSIIWSGNFKPLKTLNIVLLALGKLRTVSSDWEILCLGDGPCEGSWKKLARALDIADHCRFLGRLPRAEALRVMASGHCLVQPSLYDATSNVLVEALAMGLPVVCLDHFGFRDAIDSSCGIRIPAGTLNQVVNDFANALQRLVEDENLRHALAIGARNASTRLTWRYKANVLSDLYSQVMAANVHFDGDCPVPQATTNAR